MPSKIELAGGVTVLVQEDPEAVAAAFSATAGRAGQLVKLTRKEGYAEPAGVEGQPVYLNPAQTAAVTGI